MLFEQLFLDSVNTKEEKVINRKSDTNFSIENKEHRFYYKNTKRDIVLVEDNESQQLALDRLKYLRENFRIPSIYEENWDNIILFNTKGNVEKAYAIGLDINDGFYDVRNKLNDLTGKEWTKFTASTFVFNALQKDLKEEREISKDAQLHPATYSTTMMEQFIEFFTKEGESVLDPFAGIGSTLVGSQRTNRIGYGIELNKKYFDVMKKRVPEFENSIFNYDSAKLKDLPIKHIDFSISSPPYWDVLNRSTKDFKKEREIKGLDVNYSKSEADLGNISDYNNFIKQTTDIYNQVYDVMRTGAYLIVIVKNVKKGGKIYPLAWDLAKSIGEKFTLKDEKIWIQDQQSLAPYGYPNSWASNILHHYCLIFRKED